MADDKLLRLGIDDSLRRLLNSTSAQCGFRERRRTSQPSLPRQEL